MNPDDPAPEENPTGEESPSGIGDAFDPSAAADSAQDLAESAAYAAMQDVANERRSEESHGLVEADTTSTCLSSCLGHIVMVLVILAGVLGGGFFLWPDGDDTPSQDPLGQNPPFAADGQGGNGQALANTYNAAGQLIPITGVWDIYNGEGAATCIGGLTLDANTQTGNLEVLNDGESILITEITEDGLGEPIRLDRISASETEAVYYADLSEETGQDFEVEMVFSSSSTVAVQLAGCPDRGGQGSLIEPGTRDPVEQVGEAGDDDSEADSLDLPEHLTVDVPDGGTVTGSVSDTGYANAFVEYSADRYEEIVAFYGAWTSTDSRAWSGGDSSYESQGQTVRGNIWDSTASHIGVADCRAGGGSGDFDAVCVQITDEG